MDVSAANDAYLRLSQTVGNAERYIRDNVDEQGRFNQEISAGTQQANELTNTIKRAVAAYISIQSVGKALNISDELVQTTSRLNMMNDGVQTTAELVNMVYAAAQEMCIRDRQRTQARTSRHRMRTQSTQPISLVKVLLVLRMLVQKCRMKWFVMLRQGAVKIH